MKKLISYYSSNWKACLSIFKIKTAEGLQYRMAGIAGATTGIFWVLIEITVYTVFYRYADNRFAGVMAGLTLKQLITYSWLAQIFFLMQPMNIDSEILNKIINGDVGIEMCRPLDLYFHWFSKIAATRLIPLFWRGSITLIAGILMPSSYRLSLPASAYHLMFMLLSIVSAFFLCSAYGMLIVVIRLGVTWGDGPTYILLLIGGVLSGGYLPLQLWPEFLQRFLLLQPFAGYLDIPMRLYLGVLPLEKAMFAIALQLIWAGTFIFLGKLIITAQLKKIIVQGG